VSWQRGVKLYKELFYRRHLWILANNDSVSSFCWIADSHLGIELYRQIQMNGAMQLWNRWHCKSHSLWDHTSHPNLQIHFTKKTSFNLFCLWSFQKLSLYPFHSFCEGNSEIELIYSVCEIHVIFMQFLV